MKCRALRRRYLVFKVEQNAPAALFIDSLAKVLAQLPPGGRGRCGTEVGKPSSPDRPYAPPIKLVYNDGEYAIIRLDNASFERLRSQSPFPIKISVAGQGGSAASLFCTGSIKKAKIRIKAIRRNIVMGMKRPSQSIQNAKDVELERSEGESPAGKSLRPL